MNSDDPRTSKETVYVNTAAAPAWLREWLSKGWLVFNAPRPLPGVAMELWEFMHGTFYTVIDPSLPLADRVVQEVRDLDGWPVVLVSNEEIQERVLRHLEEGEVALSDALESWGGWPELAWAAGWPWHKDGAQR